MFNTMYKLCVFNQETNQHHPVHLCSPTPSFKDFLEKIRSITQIHAMENYDITFSIHDKTIIIQDDQSLQQALHTLAVDQPKLEISLAQKKKTLDSLHVSNLCCLQDKSPFEPTIIQWDSSRKRPRRHIDFSRKLPDPISLLPDPAYHPLDLKRPLIDSFSILPTISSLTTEPSQHYDLLKLAPILKRPLKRTRASCVDHGVFVCDHGSGTNRLCGQTFRRSYDLSRHQAIHLENRPFCYCHECGKKFTRMDALRRHERVQGHTSPAKQRSMSTSALPFNKTV